jgi:hypothetical protein
MTEHLRVVPSGPRRPKRASRGALRAWTWVAGGASFLLPTAILSATPRPAASAVPSNTTGQAPVVIIHHVVRRVVVRSAPRVVTVGAPAVVTGVGAAPPAASTGGSHP